MNLLKNRYVPLCITLSRLVLSPLLLTPLLVFAGSSASILLWATAFCFFFLLCLTDFFDGYLARKYEVVNKSGTVLDPIADKFLVISTSVGLLATGALAWWWVLLFLCRDTFVMSLRLWGAQVGVDVPVWLLAKLKTVLVMFALGLVMFDQVVTLAVGAVVMPLHDLSFATLLIAAILSFVTMLVYAHDVYETCYTRGYFRN